MIKKVIYVSELAYRLICMEGDEKCRGPIFEFWEHLENFGLVAFFLFVLFFLYRQ